MRNGMKRMWMRGSSGFGAAVAAIVWLASPAAGLTFTPLGDLPGGDFNSSANGISADGNVVVGTGDGPLDTEAFRWTQATGMVSLGDFPGGVGDASFGYATDADGSRVVGQGSSTNGREAFRWDAPLGPMTGLGFLGGTPPESTAYGISADGSVIVGRSTSASGAEAFRWTAFGVEGCGALQGCMITLGDFPTGGTDSTATDVSDDGSVVVGAGLHAGPIGEAFRWTSGSGLFPLGDLPGGSTESLALGVSGDGSTVVGSSYSGNGLEAFVWTVGSGMQPLDDLAGGAFESRAHDASGDGSLIVGYGTAGDGQRAVIWSSGALFDLNLIAAAVLPAGWVLEEAFGISSDGLAIVGRGSHLVNNVSVDEAFLLRLDAAPIPEPGTGALLALGLLTLAVKRHRR